MNIEQMHSLRTVSEALESGEVSARELIERYLERIESSNPTINAYIDVFADSALEQASLSDERRHNGSPRSPLDGVAIALKDNIDVEGRTTTNGLASGPVAGRSAPLVRRLEADGAIILGKLNMHECALGGSTNNPHWGAAHNPWKTGFSPGGSSGGSGAAVAAGLCAGALGSDTLGSIRLPAAYCGIAGFKPSFGLISLSGVVPLSFRLDHVGPMTARVGDLGLMLDAMAGHEPGDSTSRVDRDTASYDVPPLESLQGMRVGIIENFAAVTTDASVVRHFDAVVDAIVGAGAVVETLKLDGFEPQATRRAALVIIEAHGAAMMDRYRTAEHGMLSDAVQKMFDYGRNVPGVRLARSDLTVFEAATTFRNALAEVDMILSPTTSRAPFAFEDKEPEDQAELTALANLAGSPALSLPMGLSDEGLPLGLQVMTPRFTDRKTLAIGRLLEAMIGFEHHPG